MKKKFGVALIASSLFLAVGSGVYAGANLQEIQAYLNGDIKFKVNGSDWRPKNEEGNEILPITYDGTTYVPLRAISGAIKTSIDYDAETNTVIVGEKVNGVSFFSETITNGEMFSNVEDVLDKKQLIIDGKQYEGAFRNKIRNQYPEKIHLRLGKEYQKAHLVLASTRNSSSVKITNEKDQILAETSIEKDKVVELDVDLHASKELKFVYMGTSDGGYFQVLKNSTVK